MPYTMEHNKIVGAILTAMIVASASGNLARILYPEEKMEEPLVRVEAAADQKAATEEAPAEPRSLAELLAEADPATGAKVAKKCLSCHSVEKGGPHKVGPNLWEIVGRPVAGAEGFAYSEALKSLGGTWTFERLDAFLADPKGYAPGTKMAFAGIRKPADRAALLAYLRTLADEPVPLPAVEEQAATVDEEGAPEEAGPATAREAEPATGTGGAEQAAAGTEATGDEATSGSAAGAPATEEPVAPAQPAGEQSSAEPTEQTAAGTPAHPVLALLPQADPERGAKIARRCAACHSFDKGGPHKVGPNLWAIVDRPVASAEGFRYSKSLRDFGGDWTWERLARFLEDPRGTVPGTRMAFAGIAKPQDLADLLAYLRTLADEPAPLP